MLLDMTERMRKRWQELTHLELGISASYAVLDKAIRKESRSLSDAYINFTELSCIQNTGFISPVSLRALS